VNDVSETFGGASVYEDAAPTEAGVEENVIVTGTRAPANSIGWYNGLSGDWQNNADLFSFWPKLPPEGILAKMAAARSRVGNVGVAPNPSANGQAPMYEISAMSPVNKYSAQINFASSQTGVDPRLIRSVMYMETTHGYYDSLVSWYGGNDTILPM